MTASLADFLATVRLFQELSAAQRVALAQRTSQRRLETGETVFFQGDPADRVYVVRRGEVAVEVPARNGRSVALATLTRGDVFGEMAVIDAGPRSASVRATQPGELVCLTAAVFLDLVDASPTFAQALLRDLVARLRATDSQVEMIAMAPLRQRLAATLLDLQASRGNTIQITQAALAARLSATREKVNVHLQVLREAGAIALSRGRIEILNANVLSKFDHSS